jgi:hypothetical protein
MSYPRRILCFYFFQDNVKITDHCAATSAAAAEQAISAILHQIFVQRPALLDLANTIWGERQG